MYIFLAPHNTEFQYALLFTTTKKQKPPRKKIKLSNFLLVFLIVCCVPSRVCPNEAKPKVELFDAEMNVIQHRISIVNWKNIYFLFRNVLRHL